MYYFGAENEGGEINVCRFRCPLGSTRENIKTFIGALVRKIDAARIVRVIRTELVEMVSITCITRIRNPYIKNGQETSNKVSKVAGY